MKLRLAVVAVVFTLISLRPVRADLLFTLNPAGLTGAPGTTVTFNATLTNTGSDTLFLNGDSFNTLDAGLTLDDTPFINNFPPSLLGGDAVTSDIFTVTIDPTVLPGNYGGSFTITGGLDEFAQDTLATQNFLVTVAVAPEPSIVLPALVACGGILLLRRRSKRRRPAAPAMNGTG